MSAEEQMTISLHHGLLYLEEKERGSAARAEGARQARAHDSRARVAPSRHEKVGADERLRRRRAWADFSRKRKSRAPGSGSGYDTEASGFTTTWN